MSTIQVRKHHILAVLAPEFITVNKLHILVVLDEDAPDPPDPPDPTDGKRRSLISVNFFKSS